MSVNVYIRTGTQVQVLTSAGVSTAWVDANYYPRSNPSGYASGIDGSIYVQTGETGAFYAASNPSGYITGDYYNKDEIDNLIRQVDPLYFTMQTVTDFSGYENYKYMRRTYPTGDKFTGVWLVTGTNQWLTGFVTKSGVPGYDTTIDGVNEVYIKFSRAAGNVKDVAVYYTLSVLKATGGLSLITTSRSSNWATETFYTYAFQTLIPSYPIYYNDRLVLNFYAELGLVGPQNPTLYMVFDGNTATREVLPYNTEAAQASYYPRNNPSGFITASATGSFVGKPWPFSKSLVISNVGGILSGTHDAAVWRVNKSCTCTGIWGWRSNGDNAVAHAYKNDKTTPLLAATGLHLSVSSGWMSSGVNVPFNMGDTLLCSITNLTGLPTAITIQADFLEY